VTRWMHDVRAPAQRHHLLAVLTGAGAVALAVAVVLVRPDATTEDRPAAATTAATSSSAPPSGSAAGPPQPSSAPDPAHVAELQEVAAGLPPLSLSSPASWDRWLPEGKPYPGVDTADDLSTCPVLSARLETVIGQEMSYWTGTLPNGPAGCTWVEIPLSGQDNDYDYSVSVGFLADGTTAAEFRLLREGTGQGTHPCPSTDVPTVTDGALLTRCSSPAGTAYTLALPDTRLDGGVWVLSVNSKDSTPVRPAAVLPVLLDGVAATFG